MKKYFASVFIVLSIIAACKSSKQKNPQEKQANKKNFFPVADYLQSEINYVDSLPLGIIRYTVHNSITDSVFIQSPEFNQIAKDFICPELKPDIFENEFSESSFIDETTQSATFIYSTKNNKLELQRVDVIANAGEGTNKVSSIYLEKVIHKNDTLTVKKLLWRTRKSFQIITSIQPSNHAPVIKQVKVTWNPE